MNWENKIAENVKEVPFSGIRKFFDLASTMEDVISLGVGEPDYSSVLLHPDNHRPKQDLQGNVLPRNGVHYTMSSAMPLCSSRKTRKVPSLSPLNKASIFHKTVSFPFLQ